MNFPQSWTKETFVRVTTPETYRKIKELGLEPAMWNDFPVGTKRNNLLSLCDKFVLNYSPCLFIYDPINENVKKGYLFGVTKISEVENWLNENNLKDYSYLITSQVTNHRDGFVGTVFSDGNGKIFCETLHKPNVCNHRELSRPKENTGKYLDYVIFEEGQLCSSGLTYLTPEMINEIADMYIHQKGYFEFVNGVHLGRKSLITTGFEMLDFPHEIHMQFILDAKKRTRTISRNQVQRP